MRNITNWKLAFLAIVAVVAVAMIAVYLKGHHDGSVGKSLQLSPEAQAARAKKPAGAAPGAWSPTKPYPKHNVYYPGTEELKPDEMRVIALGSGMPMPRRKQAAACFLIELGNGDKFIFDMGTGSMARLYALGIPLDFIDKVFISHLHADHMGD